MNNPILTQLQFLKSQIPPDVRLIAVSKTMTVDSIRKAYQGGIRDFAENKLQEAISKQEELTDLPDICWHFIGHLQSNKVKKAVESFPWIHSIDSLKVAEKTNRLAHEALKEGIIKEYPNICLQVKILADESKFGWNVSELSEDIPFLTQLKSIRPRGLMAILPLGLSQDESLKAFKQVKILRDELKKDFGTDFDQLSMGMSGDYLLAIEAGATMIRLGTIIFGKRNYHSNPK